MEPTEYIKDENGQYILTSAGKKVPVSRVISAREIYLTDYSYKPKYCKIKRSNLTILVPRGIDIIGTGHAYEYYEIDLEMCNTAAQLLDYIAQVSYKTWMTPELFDDLFRTIKQACKDIIGNSIQGVFCPSGQDTKVDWKKGTRTVIKKNRGK
jgi:hypothetical protein